MKHYKLKYLKSFILLSVLLLTFFCSCASSSHYQVKKIIPPDNPFSFSAASPIPEFEALILADLHGYNMDKLVNDEKAWGKYKARTKKVFDTNFTNTKKILIDSAGDETDFLIIAGDFTVNGEKQSHYMLADILKNYEKSGKQVYIVPGNHDVNNPQGLQFLEKQGKYARPVTDTEFETIYRNYGYSEALYRDENSLSYAAEPVPGLMLVCIDSCAWQKNIYFPFRWAAADGRLKTKTRLWLKSVFKRAQQQGKSIIAVQHHPFSEEVFRKAKTLADSDKIRELYKEYGVSLVIAGHRHKYYINSTDEVPQIIAPNISKTPANGLFIQSGKSRITVTRNPYNYSE